MGHLEDAFLFSESKRYDIKGKTYFDSPSKYYSEDIGLRNARIGFRQQEKTEVELRPFALIGDSFPKIVVRKDVGKRWYDEKGILNINLIDFLLDKELI